MNANATLLQMKYARVVDLFAKQANISRSDALTFFYRSVLYRLMKNGVSDMHCMSDAYLAEDLLEEYREEAEKESISASTEHMGQK